MRRLISLLCAVLLLSSCAALPTDLRVQSGPELLAPNTQEFAYYSPSGPVRGASAQEIVSGFLSAGTGPQNDYAIAREFLTKDFAPRWRPDQAVLVRSGSPIFSSLGQSLQVVTINISAKLDSQGRYQDNQEPKATELRFQLVQEDGEWRIGSAPNLTVVSPPVFAVVFNALPVFFLDSVRQNLVPDLRWFPSRASTGTRLVAALLDGPSEWLAPGVTSAIPSGTKLTIEAVRVVQGVARVDFDATLLDATAAERRLILSQLRATLLQLPGVSDVTLSVNNSILDIGTASLATVTGSGQAYVASEGGIEKLTVIESSEITGSSEWVRRFEPQLVAVADGGARVGFSSSDGIYLASSSSISARVEKVDSFQDLAALEFDRSGYLWAFPKDLSEPVLAFDRSGALRKLQVGGEGLRLAASTAPEGARIAQIVQREQATSIELLTVSKVGSSTPTRLNPGLSLNPVLGNAVSLAWQTPNSLRALELTTSGLSALSEYSASGPRAQLSMPPVNGVKVVAGPGSIASYLLSDRGEVWGVTGNSWRKISTGITDMATLR